MKTSPSTPLPAPFPPYPLAEVEDEKDKGDTEEVPAGWFDIVEQTHH
ncbi:hypothetical protein [Magnetospirillum molischianum]|nr:hypothetical protein [Magnetospirillum molischianum]